jgi:uncharacterized protein YggU (UPF0235/DUF167 family)
MTETLTIRVTPRASRNAVKVEPQGDGSVLYRVYVTTAAEDGKANKAVIEVLAEALGLRKSALTIVQGLTSRNKVIRVER